MRFDTDTFREISDSLGRNRSRSFLTGFGVFWGIFMLLFLSGGGQGLKQMLSGNFEGFATNTTILWASKTTKPYLGFRQGREWWFTADDVGRLRASVPELDIVTPVVSQWGQTVLHGTNSFSASVRGVNPDYAGVETPKLKYGRYINETDVLHERKVCVIGKRVYTSLFPDGGDPCGERIKVGPVWFTVVGVDYNSGNISINGSADSAVILPFSIVQKLYNRGDAIDMICVTGHRGVKISALEPRLRELVARWHKFNPSDKQALFVFNTEEIFSIVDNLFRGVNFLILLVGLGTILAGAIGVSNIMMVTVRERTTEIGIRRAIGATPKDILLQIILESITLTIASGTAGIVFAVLLLSSLEVATSHQAAFQIGFWPAVAALFLLTLLGVLAGLAPASRAMKIKPVDAMRDE